MPAKPLEVPLKTVPTTTTIAGTSTTAPQPVTAASPTSETAVAETVTPTGSRSGGIAKFLHRLVLGAALMALLAALIGLVLRRTPWGLRRLLMGIAALSIAAVALLSLFGILDSAVSHGNRLLPLRIVAAISLLGAAVIRLVVADRTLDRYDLMMYTRTKGATDRVGFASVERVMQRFPAVLGGHILFATLLVVGAALLMVR